MLRTELGDDFNKISPQITAALDTAYKQVTDKLKVVELPPEFANIKVDNLDNYVETITDSMYDSVNRLVDNTISTGSIDYYDKQFKIIERTFKENNKQIWSYMQPLLRDIGRQSRAFAEMKLGLEPNSTKLGVTKVEKLDKAAQDATAALVKFRTKLEGSLEVIQEFPNMEYRDTSAPMFDDPRYWELMSHVFRNAYMSGTDAALLDNISHYNDRQLPGVAANNLPDGTRNANQIPKQKYSLETLVAMVRGRVLEPVIASSFQSLMLGFTKKLFAGGNFIDKAHEMQAQIDRIFGSFIGDLAPFDIKATGKTNFLNIKVVQEMPEEGYGRYEQLVKTNPDIAKQLVVQAETMGVDTAYIGAFNTEDISMPNLADFLSWYDPDNTKPTEDRLEAFFNKAILESSKVNALGMRVLDNFYEKNAMVSINIPPSERKQMREMAKLLLKWQAELVGPAIAGDLGKYLVGYTAGGAPIDLLGSDRNLPTLDADANILKMLTTTPIDSEKLSDIKGLNSILVGLVKDIKGSSEVLRENAYIQLENIRQTLLDISKRPDTGMVTEKVLGELVTATTMGFEDLANAILDVQDKFEPNRVLASMSKTQTDLLVAINGKVGEVIGNTGPIHTLVHSAKQATANLESFLGIGNELSSKLGIMIAQGKITAMDNTLAMATLEQVIKFTQEAKAQSGVDYEGLTKAYFEVNKINMPNVARPDDKVMQALTSLLQTKFSMEGTVKQLADIAMVLKQTTDVRGYDGMLAYLKTIDPEGLRKAVEELGRGGPTTLGSGFGAFGKTMQDTANVIKNAAGSFTLWTAETVRGSVFGDIASKINNTIIDKPIDAINNTIYSTLSNAIHGAGLDVWNAEWNTAGYTKATQFGIRNPYAADMSELNPVNTRAYDFLFRHARSAATGQHMAGVEAPGLSDSSYTFQYKEPKFMTKTLNKWAAADSATKAAKISNFMSNIPIYLQMASFVTEAMRAEDNVKAYTEFAKNLSDEGIATLDLQQLLQDALEVRSGYVTLDLTNFQGLDEHGILKGLLNPTRWDPNAFSDLGQALNKQVDSLSAQERYFIQAMRGGDTTAAKQNLIFGTSGKEDTAEMMSAINLLLNSESDLATVIKNELVDKGYGQTDSAETASDEALAYLSSVIKSFQSEYEKSITAYMDTVMKYNPRVDSPLMPQLPD